MTDKKDVYVVMRASGKIMQFRDGISGDRSQSAGPYTSILDTIANEMSGSGGDWDQPEKLFLNGVLVIDSGLSSKAFEYQRDSVAAREQARRAVNKLHRPDWSNESDGFHTDARGWKVVKSTS